MTPEQEEQLVDMILVTAEVMGHELKPSAVMMMVSDLSGYDFAAVANTLNRCRKEQTGRLTLKGILDLLAHYAPEPGWPLYLSFLRMIDFIAGMTDSYATEMAREMTGRSSPV